MSKIYKIGAFRSILVIFLLIIIYLAFDRYTLYIKKQGLMATQISEIEAIEMNKSCTPSAGILDQDVFGLSDPSFLDDRVQDFAIELGTTWIRADFRWRDIEKNNGEYDFSTYDKLVSRMKENNIRIVGIINTLPPLETDWINISTRYERFLKKILEKYGDTVSYWEVFNEPNLPGYGWLERGMKGEDYIRGYAELLSITNRTIRKIHPKSFLILGGLSPDGTDPIQFLNSLNRLQSSNCYDIIGFHPYGYEGNFNKILKLLNSIESQKANTQKPIWFTEYGSPDNKRKIALLRDILQERNNNTAIFWFAIKDFSPISDFYGVIDFYNRKKDIYEDFKRLIHL